MSASRGTSTVGSRYQAAQWRPWLRTLLCVWQWCVKCNHVLCVKCPINPITNPNPVHHHSITWQYIMALDYAAENSVLFLLFHPIRRTKLIVLYCCERAFETVLKSILNFTRHKAGRRVSHYYVAKLFSSAYLTLSSPQNAINIFQFSGVWHQNLNNFSDNDYASVFSTSQTSILMWAPSSNLKN
jgi:hypothetical protein